MSFQNSLSENWQNSACMDFLYITKCNNMKCCLRSGETGSMKSLCRNTGICIEIHWIGLFGAFVFFFLSCLTWTHFPAAQGVLPYCFYISLHHQRKETVLTNSECILCRKFFSLPFTVRECVEFWGRSNGFKGAEVKAELEFIYSNLEQLGKAAHVHWRDKDRRT